MEADLQREDRSMSQGAGLQALRRAGQFIRPVSRRSDLYQDPFHELGQAS